MAGLSQTSCPFAVPAADNPEQKASTMTKPRALTASIAVPAALAILTIFVSLLVLPRPGAAHELRPAIADITLTPTRTAVEININVESIMAGIDLAAVEDTDHDTQAASYDSLRALDAAALTEAFTAYWPQMRELISLSTANDEQLLLSLVGLEVPSDVDASLPRYSVITIRADATPAVAFSWDARYGDVIVRQQGVSEDLAYTALVPTGAASALINNDDPPVVPMTEVIVTYLISGFDHILPKGLDHILFVIGLCFYAPRFIQILWQVSAFTVAHTLTLAIASAGLITPPGSIIEPLIALSIAYIAVENIFPRARLVWRPTVIFAFGLLHGFGFASVLAEFGLPFDQFIVALISFNIGVELGQLVVVAACVGGIMVWTRHKSWYQSAVAVPISAFVGLVGLYWFMERTIL